MRRLLGPFLLCLLALGCNTPQPFELDMSQPIVEERVPFQAGYAERSFTPGKGYPLGLAGEDVALPGRILVLAEVYDALAEQRSYKPAWPVEKIVAFFRDQAGRQFDPDLAGLVADGLERQGKRYFAAHADSLF